MNFGRRMRKLEQLKKQWNDSARLRGVQANICLGPDGLTLGARTVVAKRNHDGSLALDGEETKVFALLSVAYGQALEPSILKTIRRISDSARDGDECKAAMYLALAKLPRISDPADTARRLFIADGLIAAGVAPRDIWKALDFDSAIFDSLAKYNQDQPRVPAGSGKPSGEWTSGGAANANANTAAAIGALAPAAMRAGQAVAEEAEAQAPRILAGLPGIALRLASIAARLNLPLAALIETLRASPTGGDRIVGRVSGLPNVYSERQQDELGVHLIDRSTGHTIATLYPTGVRGQYADRESGIVAQMEGADLRVRSAIGTASQAQTRKKEPDECPEPGLDLPGMIGTRGLRSKGYENYMKLWLNPGKPTPPGVGFQLENPETGKLVYYDDCQHETGLMAEYKGENIARIIAWATRAQRLDVLARLANRWVRQATSQIDASEGRPVAWFFAEQGALDFARTVFSHAADPRLAEVALSLRPPPEKRAWWRDYAKTRRREVGTPNCTGRSRSNVSGIFLSKTVDSTSSELKWPSWNMGD
jgi:hypothetical protein